jgi:hypothetical protein
VIYDISHHQWSFFDPELYRISAQKQALGTKAAYRVLELVTMMMTSASEHPIGILK